MWAGPCGSRAVDGALGVLKEFYAEESKGTSFAQDPEVFSDKLYVAAGCFMDFGTLAFVRFSCCCPCARCRAAIT